MPLKDGSLTRQETLFVKAYAETGSKSYAAHKAKLSDPARSAGRVIARPEVAAAVRAEQSKYIENNLLPKAVTALEKILVDATAEKPLMAVKSHLEAIKITLSYTLGRNSDGADKAPEDMTGAEITARIEMLRAQRDQLLDALPDAEIIEQEPAQEGGIFG